MYIYNINNFVAVDRKNQIKLKTIYNTYQYIVIFNIIFLGN